jgi:MAE_28990/MAE_18760-like HEPN
VDLAQAFDDRLQEINAYLSLLEALERQIREGPPRIGGETITGQQQRILYSAVYLQLYNLVEATATWRLSGMELLPHNGLRLIRSH